MAKALGRLLRRRGFNVQLAHSASEALALLDHFTPDLVISDYRMPDVNGVELLVEIRRRLPGIPTFILSGYMDVNESDWSISSCGSRGSPGPCRHHRGGAGRPQQGSGRRRRQPRGRCAVTNPEDPHFAIEQRFKIPAEIAFLGFQILNVSLMWNSSRAIALIVILSAINVKRSPWAKPS